jgi:hypothetical protein
MRVQLPLVAAAGRTPALWTVGLVGFLGRGGLILILLPMLVLPSPVSLSVLIGPDLVDANGLSARVEALLALAGVIGLLFVAAGLVMAVLADVGAFEGLLSAAGIATRPSSRRGTGLLALELLALQLLATLPVLLAAVPASISVVNVTRQEILLPGDQSLPLVARVAEGAWPALALVAAMTLVSAHLYTVLGRELLARRSGLLPAPSRRGLAGLVTSGAGALIRRPLQALASSLVAWLLGLAAAAVAAVAIAAGWTLVQNVYLSSAGADGATVLVTAATWLVAAVATAVLAALVGLALSAIGAAAALRSAMLTQAVLDGRGVA